MIYFLLHTRSRPAIPRAPITAAGNIPDFCVVVTGTVVAIVPVVGTAEGISCVGGVLVAVRILTCTELNGGITVTI
jgi:hypothetical protein